MAQTEYTGDLLHSLLNGEADAVIPRNLCRLIGKAASLRLEAKVSRRSRCDAASPKMKRRSLQTRDPLTSALETPSFLSGKGRRKVRQQREPIALSAEEAATFLGISQGTFLTAVDKKLFPEGHQLLGRVLWDGDELIAAFKRLPRRGGATEDAEDGIDWDDVTA